MDGWKGRPPLDRCLEANVTSPKLHIPSKAPPNIQPKEEDQTDRHQGYYILRLKFWAGARKTLTRDNYGTCYAQS
jgi:hypothetical protein